MSRPRRHLRQAKLGIECPEQLVWKSWVPGEEYTRKLVIKNTDACSQTVLLTLPEHKTLFLMPYPSPVTLSSGMSFDVDIRFRPVDMVEMRDVISVTVKDRGSFAVSLDALLPFVRIDVPRSHDFELCAVDATAQKGVTMTNTGTCPIDFAWESAAPFAVIPATGVLQTNESTTLSLQFHPTEACAVSTELICRVGGVGDAVASVHVKGVGKYPFVRILCNSPDGDNNGATTSNPMAAIGMHDSHGTVTAKGMTRTTPAGAVGGLAEASAAGATGGAVAAHVTPAARVTGAASSSSSPLPVSAATASLLDVSTFRIDFGEVDVSQSASCEFYVQNPSPVWAQVTVHSDANLSADQGPFELTPTHVTLPPQGRQLCRVVFLSCRAGTVHLASYQLHTHAGNTITLSVRGVAAGVRLRASTSYLDFGDVLLCARRCTSAAAATRNNAREATPTAAATANVQPDLARWVLLQNVSHSKAWFTVLTASPAGGGGGAAFEVSPVTGSIDGESSVRLRVTFKPTAAIHYLRRFVVLVQNGVEAISLDCFGTGYDGEDRPLPVTLAMVQPFYQRLRCGLGNVTPPQLAALTRRVGQHRRPRSGSCASRDGGEAEDGIDVDALLDDDAANTTHGRHDDGGDRNREEGEEVEEEVEEEEEGDAESVRKKNRPCTRRLTPQQLARCVYHTEGSSSQALPHSLSSSASSRTSKPGRLSLPDLFALQRDAESSPFALEMPEITFDPCRSTTQRIRVCNSTSSMAVATWCVSEASDFDVSPAQQRVPPHGCAVFAVTRRTRVGGARTTDTAFAASASAAASSSVPTKTPSGCYLECYVSYAEMLSFRHSDAHSFIPPYCLVLRCGEHRPPTAPSPQQRQDSSVHKHTARADEDAIHSVTGYNNRPAPLPIAAHADSTHDGRAFGAGGGDGSPTRRITVMACSPHRVAAGVADPRVSFPVCQVGGTSYQVITLVNTSDRTAVYHTAQMELCRVEGKLADEVAVWLTQRSASESPPSLSSPHARHAAFVPRRSSSSSSSSSSVSNAPVKGDHGDGAPPPCRTDTRAVVSATDYFATPQHMGEHGRAVFDCYPAGGLILPQQAVQMVLRFAPPTHARYDGCATWVCHLLGTATESVSVVLSGEAAVPRLCLAASSRHRRDDTAAHGVRHRRARDDGDADEAPSRAVVEDEVPASSSITFRPTGIGGGGVRLLHLRNPTPFALSYTLLLSPTLREVVTLTPDGGSLAGGAWQRITARFRPRRAVRYAGDVSILVHPAPRRHADGCSHAAAAAGSISALVTRSRVCGEGVRVAVAVEPRAMDLGRVPAHRPMTVSFRLINSGVAAVWFEVRGRRVGGGGQQRDVAGWEGEGGQQRDVAPSPRGPRPARGVLAARSHQTVLVPVIPTVGPLEYMWYVVVTAAGLEEPDNHMNDNHTDSIVNYKDRMDSMDGNNIRYDIDRDGGGDGPVKGDSDSRTENTTDAARLDFPSTDWSPAKDPWRHPHCVIRLDAMRPALQVVDAAAPGIRRSFLWRQLGLDRLNAQLAAPVQLDDVAGDLVCFDAFVAALEPVAMDLGVAPVGSTAVVATLRLSNTSECRAKFRLWLPTESEAAREHWFVEDDAALYGMRRVMERGIVQVGPCAGELAPQESALLTLTYRHVERGVHTLPLLLRVNHGRRVLLVLQGRTVGCGGLCDEEDAVGGDGGVAQVCRDRPAAAAAEKKMTMTTTGRPHAVEEDRRRVATRTPTGPVGVPRCLLLHHPSSYTLAPVALGDGCPPRQITLLANPLSVAVRYAVEGRALRRLARANFHFPVLRCVNPRGVVAPHAVMELGWYFCPLEAKTYTMHIPLHVEQGEGYVLSFVGTGYHPPARAVVSSSSSSSSAAAAAAMAVTAADSSWFTNNPSANPTRQETVLNSIMGGTHSHCTSRGRDTARQEDCVTPSSSAPWLDESPHAKTRPTAPAATAAPPPPTPEAKPLSWSEVRSAMQSSFLDLPDVASVWPWDGRPQPTLTSTPSVLRLGVIPFFSLHRRTLRLVNPHPTDWLAFVWDTSHGWGDHVLRIVPCSGSLAPGAVVHCRVWFYAGSRSQVMEWSVMCEVHNETRMRAAAGEAGGAAVDMNSCRTGRTNGRARGERAEDGPCLKRTGNTGGGGGDGGGHHHDSDQTNTMPPGSAASRTDDRKEDADHACRGAHAARKERVWHAKPRATGRVCSATASSATRALAAKVVAARQHAEECGGPGKTTAARRATEERTWPSAIHDGTDVCDAATMTSVELLIQARVLPPEDYVQIYGQAAMQKCYLPMQYRSQPATRNMHHHGSSSHTDCPTRGTASSQGRLPCTMEASLVDRVMDGLIRGVVHTPAVQSSFTDPFVRTEVTYRDIVAMREDGGGRGEDIRLGAPCAASGATRRVAEAEAVIEETLDEVIFDLVNTIDDAAAGSLLLPVTPA